MTLCRTLLTGQQFTGGFSFSGINEIQAVLFYYYLYTIIVLINILLHGNISNFCLFLCLIFNLIYLILFQVYYFFFVII